MGGVWGDKADFLIQRKAESRSPSITRQRDRRDDQEEKERSYRVRKSLTEKRDQGRGIA